MAEDRKKMLEALVAKRKAEAAGGGRLGSKSKPSPLPSSKPASVHKSSPVAHKPNAKPSALLQQKKHQHHKKESSPKKKKKRVEKYDTEDDEDEDESDEDSDSEEEPVKKKVPSVKGGSAAKPSSLKPPPFKGKQQGTKGKASVKETAKGKRKSKDSSDDDDDGGSGDDDEEAAEADSGDEGLDTTNILPGRTRRGAKPVHYDFTNMSGDDDDDSD